MEISEPLGAGHSVSAVFEATCPGCGRTGLLRDLPQRMKETQKLSDRQEEREVDKLTLMGKADERARLRNWLALLALVVGASMLVVGILGLIE